MKLKEIFKKDITRHIEGVIKVDDSANIAQEVDEYVITNEVKGKLDSFFDVYASTVNTDINNIGVWLSGFFGSGKSHMLKMLSYILENREVNGGKIANIMLDKIDDNLLKANIEKSLRLPTEVILFNIDQKSNIGNQHKAENLLPIFIKVMNELQGYSSILEVAEFELDLERQGIYPEFKSKYESITNKSWEKGRQSVFLGMANIAKTLAELNNTTIDFTSNVLESYKSKVNQISIEDFALRVREYIDKQPENFRLIFCVDEIGQFISGNSRLMLNLQTIVESLATKCGNQAWLLVTSQEALERVIGDMTKAQSYDFSKILGRFVTKLNLTSANADEVIQKRLLEKKEGPGQLLLQDYERRKNDLKTLFTFSDMTSYLYKSPEHFVFTYPFIPYQYELFAESIVVLSDNNAFQGKHQSLGERSMLSVFQLVIQKLAEEDMGKLVTYDLFFDGLREIIRSEAQRPITVAERNLDNPLAIKVLKSLFMVKYVEKKFKSTLENISRLLIDDFDADFDTLKIRVKEALNLLEDKTYVQQIGGIYEFLTDEEKDVENKIKATEVDTSDVRKELDKYIFDQIIRDPKIRLDDNGQDYRYGKKIDDILMGKQEELCINFITPMYDSNVDEFYLKNKSVASRDSDVIIQLKDDPKLQHEIEMILKTDKYIKTNSSSQLADNIRNIMANKSSKNGERKLRVRDTIEDLLANSKVYLNGSIEEINISDARTKIKQAFQMLIKNVYLNLKMLDTNYKEEDIAKILLGAGNDIHYMSDETITKAENDMRDEIERFLNNSYERLTVKRLEEKYLSKPYGWSQAAFLCIMSKLYLRRKIEIRKDSNILDNKELLKAFGNSKDFSNIFIDVLKPIDTNKINALKNFHFEFLSQQNQEIEPVEVHKRFIEGIKKELKDLEDIYTKKHTYSFLDVLEKPIKEFKKITEMLYKEVFDKMDDTYRNELIDLKEEIISPIKNFINGEKRNIYDEVISFLISETGNLPYLPADDSNNDILIKVRDEAKPYKSQTIRNAKQALEESRNILKVKLEDEKSKSLSKIDDYIGRFSNNEDFISLKENQKEAITHPFISLKENLPNERLITNVIHKIDSDLTRLYTEQISLLTRFIEENRPVDVSSPEPVIVIREVVRLNNLLPRFRKFTLDNEDEVLSYVESLKDVLLQEVRNNKKISL